VGGGGWAFAGMYEGVCAGSWMGSWGGLAAGFACFDLLAVDRRGSDRAEDVGGAAALGGRWGGRVAVGGSAGSRWGLMGLWWGVLGCGGCRAGCGSTAGLFCVGVVGRWSSGRLPVSCRLPSGLAPCSWGAGAEGPWGSRDCGDSRFGLQGWGMRVGCWACGLAWFADLVGGAVMEVWGFRVLACARGCRWVFGAVLCSRFSGGLSPVEGLQVWAVVVEFGGVGIAGRRADGHDGLV